MYKACPPTCEECLAPEGENVNCLACKKNFFLTEDTNACYEKNAEGYVYIHKTEKLAKCHNNCLHCSSRPVDDTYQKCIECRENYYITVDTKSCYDYIPNRYYLDEETKELKNCYPTCLSCVGPANEETMNCTQCISDEYFYRKDIKNCTKSNEFKKEKIFPSKWQKTIIILFLLEYLLLL